MRLTVTRCEALRRLDITLYGGEPAAVETHYGSVTVRNAATPGYCAIVGEASSFSDNYAFGATPAVALLNLVGKLAARQQPGDFGPDNVLPFPKAA
jgi:hypothetical protein